jgi:predicted AAA+ superfamily ATPase
MFSLKELHLQMKTLTIFRHLLDDKIIRAFLDILDVRKDSITKKIERYAYFTYILFQANENFTDYVWQLIFFDENIYIRRHSSRESISAMLEHCVEHELRTLQAFSKITSIDIKKEMEYDVFLPEWAINDELDFIKMYKERTANLFKLGYGIYANHKMFTYNKGKIVPVKFADTIKLTSLIGYEMERQEVIDNTLAFLEDKPAANVLLYGDAGTGKSSTVKAVVNEFSNKGLRMIEVKKGELLEIPNLVEQLFNNPLKFIVFIDDLSFSQDNEEIGALKAILEGSVAAQTANIAIYATSNRRHLIKESFSERNGDDIHLNETIQEKTSLSDRFGLSVFFSKPNKDEYLQIVYGLVKEHGINNIENLELLAERHAIERSGRSGRTARQFVEHLKSMDSCCCIKR